jgi:cytidylate kinase
VGKIVAIDGPAGAGKSTVAKMVAQRLGFLHLDSGATYRAVAWATVHYGIDPTDQQAVEELAGRVRVELRDDRVWVDGMEVTGEIRTQDMSRLASAVSAYPGVRQAMVRIQRAIGLGAEPGAVAEGRDMGTVVFPDTQYKVYLDASIEERARRRLAQLQEQGLPAPPLEQLVEEIRTRDYNDSTRQASPLCKAAGAFVLDTTGLSIEQVVDRIVQFVRSA